MSGEDQAGESLAQRVFGVGLIAALFVGAPLVWLPAGTITLRHFLIVPWDAMLAIVAVPVLLERRPAVPRWLGYGLAIYAGSIVVGLVHQGGQLLAGMRLAAWILVPMAAATCLQTATWQRRLVTALAMLWVVQLIYGAYDWAAGYPPNGFAGNRNWQAALLGGTVPWGLYWIADRWRGRVRLAMGAVGIVWTLALIWRTDCLAAVAALSAAGWAVALARLRAEKRSACVLTTVALVGGALFLAREQIGDYAKRDVRAPLATATVDMLRDHDVVGLGSQFVMPRSDDKRASFRHFRGKSGYGILGVGPGNFRSYFPPYRAASGYGTRPVAATTTEHPHNELLNVAAQLGVLGGLAWLAFWIWAFWGGVVREFCWRDAAAAFSVVTVLVHGLLDMPLVRVPVTMVAMAGLGMLIARRPQVSGKVLRRIPSLPVVLVAVVMAIVLGGFSSHRQQVLRGAYAAFRADEYGRAFDGFVRVGELGPDRTEAWRQAGTMALNHLNRPEVAVELLGKAWEREPHLGHLNRDLGRALGVLGRHEESASHFELEAALFRFDPVAQTYLATARFLDGQFEEVERALAQAVALSVDQNVRWLSPGGRSAAGEAWLAAVDAGDAAAACDAAASLCRYPSELPIDPLVSVVGMAPGGDAAAMRQGVFSEADFGYWRDAMRTARLAAQWRAVESAKGTVGGMAAVVEGEFGGADLAVRVRAYVALASARGWQAFPAVDDTGTLVGAIIGEGGRLQLVDGATGAVEPVADWRRARVAMPMQHYLLKHLVLMKMVAASTAAEVLPLPQVPSARLRELRSLPGVARDAGPQALVVTIQ